MDQYPSMTALLTDVRSAGNYHIETVDGRQSRIKIFAPHGGCIEPCTGRLAALLAGSRYDYYIFHGMRRKDCFRTLHVTSTRYDEPQCLTMVTQSEIAIALHGCNSKESFLEIGGLPAKLILDCRSHFKRNGFTVHDPDRSRMGEQPENFIHRARQGGVQFELSAGFRSMLFPHFPLATTINTITTNKFIASVHAWLHDVEEYINIAVKS